MSADLEDLPYLSPARQQAERLLDLLLRSNVSVWHSRPGVDKRGYWYPALALLRDRWPAAPAGLFVPTAVALYGTLLQIHGLSPVLSAHLACFALLQTRI